MDCQLSSVILLLNHSGLKHSHTHTVKKYMNDNFLAEAWELLLWLTLCV